MSSYLISLFRNRWRWVTAVALLALVIGFSHTGSTPVKALSTTTVNTTAIENDVPNDNVCDLWEALQAIADYNNNADTDGNGSIYTYNDCSTGPGPHVIVFTGPAAGGTITLNPDIGLTAVLPWVTDDVTITGPVVIDGNGGPGNNQVNSSIFHTNAGGKLTLLNLVVQNGYTSGAGGAILSLGGDDEINIVGSSIQNNKADGRGGAISASGKINILASNFSGNKALGTDGGWGDAFGEGGAIYQTGYNTLNISLSNFAGNIATEGGGAIYTSADSGEISDTVFNGNIVDDDAPTDQTHGGGAIYNSFNDEDEGGLTIIRSVFNGNLSFEAPGGAIFNAGDGYLHVRDSSFNGNIAGDLSNEEMGGAIYNWEVLDIRRVTFMANVSARGNGGAVANDRTGQATFANVTFTGNGAPDGDGGAIWNGNTQQGGPASNVFLQNVTLSLNLSPNAGSAIFNQTDGSHAVTLVNTIVDGTGSDACNEGLTSQGYNIDSGDTCGLTQGSDQQNTDPDLDAPGFNGGPLASLLTQALNSGSPAIDAGNNTVCANDYVENLDQRSDPRPKGPTCDIGAFEADPAVPAYGSDPVQPGPIMVGNTSVGTPVTKTFTILSVGNATLQVENPTLGGANPSEFAVLSPAFPQSISAGGNRQVVVQCNGSAIGDPTATLTFSTNAPATSSVTYNLECHVGAVPVPGYGSDPTPGGTLDFGEIYVGESGVETLTFFETGNATLTVGGADLSGAHPGDFTFNAFDGTINDGEPPSTLPITCTPGDYGLRTAVLSLTTNDPQQPAVSYNLVCEGIPLPPAPLATPGVSYIDGQGGLNTLDGAYDVAISPDGVNAYVTGFDDDALTVFRRNAETGALTFSMSISNVDLDGPQMVEVSPDGTQVYVTARQTDAFVVFNRNPASGNVTTGPVFRNGQNGVTGMDYPYGITVSPDGRYIYVTGYLSDAIVTFYREGNSVAYQGTLVDNTNLDLPYVPTISPDGQHLYVTGGTGAADNGYVSVFARNVLDGSLTFVQRRYEGQCFFLFCINGLGEAWGIAVSPDGNHVYVAGYEDDAVVRFIRDPFDGTLIYGGYITNSALQLADEQTAVTEQPALDESVSGGQTVELMEAPNTEGLNGARDVKVSPDGTYVYVTGAISDALSVFGRNPSNGILTQVQVINAAGNNPALNGAWEIAVSPDGTAVYATGNVNNSVVAFHTANPVPALDSLLPASAIAGSGNLTIRVLGQNFVPGVVGQMNGVARNTEYISPNEIEVELLAADLVNPGTRTITAMNPSPGGGLSVNNLTFTVTAPNENPIPSIDYLQPGGAPAGDPAFTLTVFGANFVNGAAVQWNGENRATTFVNSTELQVAILAGDLLIPGVAAVTAVNPGPGGGTSNAVTFAVAAPGQNPVPTITGINPHHTFARGAASNPFTIQVSGLNFIPGVQAQWNGQNRPTQFVNETTLLVTLNSFDVAFGGSGSVTAVNPGPGGGVSNPATFIIYPYAIFLPITLK
ncbi:MAG: beta-propeller fold lactonase family protein [Anaerolineae bacterium]|nr:beta-propeller fold lactonase family protein [Anaerolineae bacterium]